MRVMVLTADFPPQVWSGIGVAVDHQTQALTSIGVEVHVLFAAQSSGSLPTQAARGPFVYHLSPGFCPVDPRTFDLVHLHSLVLAEFALQVRRRFGLPIVYTVHSLLHLELEALPQLSYWQALQADLLQQSDWVIFLSEAERAAALRWIPDLESRCSVLPHGVLPPPGTPHPLPQDGPVVFAGRFARSKGLQFLAGLVPQVLASSPTHFVLAGGHGDESGTRAARSLAGRYPGRCQLAGWLDREDLDHLFARSSLVIIPSRYEPFGLVALEAMRVGAPVLASAVGGLAEIVRPESGGCLLPSRREEAWSQAILEISSSPAQREKMHSRGPDYVAEHYDRRRLAIRLRDEVYAPQL